MQSIFWTEQTYWSVNKAKKNKYRADLFTNVVSGDANQVQYCVDVPRVVDGIFLR